MADSFGALAQLTPAAGVLTDLYVAATARRATLSVRICNLGPATSIRLQHALDGAASSPPFWLIYDYALPSGQSVSTDPILLNSLDAIRVYSSSGNVTFQANGVEENA